MIWIKASVSIAGGIALFYVALWFLAEYRAAFFANPKAMLSVEIWMQAFSRPGPGLLAGLTVAWSVYFILQGVYLMSVGIDLAALR
jgi:hypothetical protein